MPVIKVHCGSCGKDLGDYSRPQFGIGPMHSETQIDPDCPDCNPNYYKICKNCGKKTIDKLGICRECGQRVS